MTFTEMFASAEHGEIEVGGRVLHQVWRRHLEGGSLHVVRISARSERRQGLVVDADVDLAVARQVGRRFVLWADTAPQTVELTVTEPTEIRIWNVWSEAGMTHAWLGWAAIHAKPQGETTLLSCRDGLDDDPEADPSDLVVGLRFVQSGR